MSVEPHRNGHPMHTPHPHDRSAAPVPEPPAEPAAPPTLGHRPPATAPRGFGPPPDAVATIPGQRYRPEPAPFAPPTRGFPALPTGGFPALPTGGFPALPTSGFPALPTSGFPAPPFPGQPGPGHPGQAYRPAPPAFPTGPGAGPGLDDRPNTLAVLSLVFAFCSPLAGLVLGIIAKRQIAESGERGDGLALAGIIVGAVCTLGTAVWTVSLVVAWSRLGQLLSELPPPS